MNEQYFLELCEKGPATLPRLDFYFSRVDRLPPYASKGALLAAGRGHRCVLERLRAHGLNPARYAQQALHLAIRYDHLDTVKHLVRSGADARFSHDLPLRIAGRYGALGPARYMVEFWGARPRALDFQALRLAVAARHSRLAGYLLGRVPGEQCRSLSDLVETAAGNGDLRTLVVMISSGKFSLEEVGPAAMEKAALCNNWRCLRWLAKRLYGTISARALQGAVMAAATRDNLALVLRIAAMGENLLSDSELLRQAVRSGSSDTFEFLLAQQAEGIVDKELLDLAIGWRQEEIGQVLGRKLGFDPEAIKKLFPLSFEDLLAQFPEYSRTGFRDLGL